MGELTKMIGRYINQIVLFENELIKLKEWISSLKRGIESAYVNIPDTIKETHSFFFDAIHEMGEAVKQTEDLFKIIDYLKTRDYSQVGNHYEAFWNHDIRMHESSLEYSLSDEKREDIKKIINKWNSNDFSRIHEDINQVETLRYEIQDAYEAVKAKVYALSLMDKIKDIDNNIVLIGANGSGKTTYAHAMAEVMTNAGSFTILESQHYLRYEMIGNWTDDDTLRELHELQKAQKHIIEDYYREDFPKLTYALLSQYVQNAVHYYETGERRESTLERALTIWKEFFPEITIRIEKYRLCPIDKQGKEYDFNDLSDGEKTVFYYIGHILTSEKNAYIVVDEPETHMNAGLSRKLWNRLEEIRNDCQFIYITHDLEFATSRLNATILWNRKFISSVEWEVETIDGVKDVPEQLVLELLGNKSTMILCEGNESSYDEKIFSVLYPDYVVRGVGNHNNVINWITALNKEERFPYKTIGIIDRDWNDDKWCEHQAKKDVYVIKANEIENVLCDEKVLQEVITNLELEEELLDNYMEKFWTLFSDTVYSQAKDYVLYHLNSELKNNLFDTSQSVSEICNSIEQTFNQTQIECRIKEREQDLQQILKHKDYQRALEETNYKKRLLNIANKTITSRYSEIALGQIKRNKGLQQYLRNKYLDDLEAVGQSD